MQSIVDSIFLAVVGLVATLLTVGLTGIVILLVTDRDSPRADVTRQALR